MKLAARNATIAGRIDNASVELERAGITAICGPNGAGKSSLLQALAGLLPPDEGAVELDGADLAAMPARERARRIGYLPQQAEIAWDVPVRSLVALGRMPHGDEVPQPIEAALSALDLHELAHRRAQSLSGGETARVLLARVLAGEPEWILADEPLAALDLAHQYALVAHLRAAAQSGTGVVLVLHDLALAMNHANRVVVLDRGQVVADGPPHEALSETIIRRVWQLDMRWIGDAGHRALIRA